jgi:PAS domain-containing protein
MTKGGVRLDVLLNATTRRDEQGNVIGMVGIGQDITGRLAQEREYTRLIDTANAPIFGVDTFGRVNVWNKCAMRLIGYATEEVMGHSLVQEVSSSLFTQPTDQLQYEYHLSQLFMPTQFITNDYQASVQGVLDEALQGSETE